MFIGAVFISAGVAALQGLRTDDFVGGILAGIAIAMSLLPEELILKLTPVVGLRTRWQHCLQLRWQSHRVKVVPGQQSIGLDVKQEVIRRSLGPKD